MFIFIVFISAGIFWGLLWVIKANKSSGRKIEIVGYFLLVLSLIWTLVYNSTQELSKGSESLMIEERLRVLWLYEGEKKKYYDTGNIDALNDSYSDFNRYLQGPAFENKLIKEQEEITNKIHYGLFILSSLFIAAGRISEVLNDNSTKKSSIKNNNSKNKKRKKRKKRQNRKR